MRGSSPAPGMPVASTLRCIRGWRSPKPRSSTTRSSRASLSNATLPLVTATVTPPLIVALVHDAEGQAGVLIHLAGVNPKRGAIVEILEHRRVEDQQREAIADGQRVPDHVPGAVTACLHDRVPILAPFTAGARSIG